MVVVAGFFEAMEGDLDQFLFDFFDFFDLDLVGVTVDGGISLAGDGADASSSSGGSTLSAALSLAMMRQERQV